MLLCVISAALTLSVGAIIANSILSTGDANMATDQAPALERFQPTGAYDRRD